MRFFRILGFLCSLLAVLLVIGVLGLYGLHRSHLPEVATVADFRPSLKSQVFAQDGELIAEFGVHERIMVDREDFPPLLVKAFIASEDKNFYRHHGIDFSGMANAVFQTLSKKRSTLRGASTITQQLAKALLVKEQGYEQATVRTVARKIKEALLARHLEMKLTKDDILWMYLNDVYLGDGSYGVAAAARSYFKKSLKDLRLGEIALLAGLPQAPSRFSPQVNLSAALIRQGYVLGRMLEDGYINQDEYDRALADNERMAVYERENSFRKLAPYFSEAVRKIVVERYGEHRVYHDGLNIFTTLNLDQERIMQQVLRTGLMEIDKRQGFSGPVFRPQNQKEVTLAREAIASMVPEVFIKGGYRLAMVEKVDTENNWVLLTSGSTRGMIPLDFMKWARPRDPASSYENALLTSVDGVMSVGDVVLVRDRNMRALALPESVREFLLKDKLRLFSLEQEPTVEGAMFTMEPDSGYVTALDGGYSFDRSEFNRILQACRLPGSLYKPVVYSAAIAIKNYTPATLVLDEPLSFYDPGSSTTWQPQNLSKGYKGEVTVREAFMKSMNIPAINVMADVGVGNVIKWSKRLGLTTEMKRELGTSIGSSCVIPFELGQVYASFAKMGVLVEPILIKEVTDRDGQRLLFQGKKYDPWLGRDDRVMLHVDDFFLEEKRIMETEAAYTMHYLLTEGARHGTAVRTNSLGRHIAGKTGTTNDSFDTWFAGYTKNLMALVWVGNDTMDIPLGVYEQGSRTALPLFNRFMEQALSGLPDEDWVMPNTMCLSRVDTKTGLSVNEDHPTSFVAPFRCGEEPAPLKDWPHQSLGGI